ncbi:isoaspartyl peptidase/L-asparaginase [Elizabethkingia anophelis]|uniref:isoaspartyl peptidase/L-asparaginase family protein n=1 Tax=Elizabethkingia TaxID=308865 RepID=UPI000739852A|nr:MULTISPECIES: isoaspartyl peptidase/L-asparaginase [Elizabethkingia]KUF42670.1 isoaspartyl peptidase [Elizabethkingia anophelis]MCT3644575.1 isoaspartyl peptidase/L-asparaginase [Elizabethkingia anophelis]MCT3651225.1 isoaspartyl peptidase/L-asparaginase [Elizabethkingia anophelis]MCT3654779.1 isoaspartyl peptidase/L-asparaginase [Elizabethkingia anophelis]MCT3658174.1 isoaspartyl peptidase/L-asparaginase [Elizabethkingia anophelis]
MKKITLLFVCCLSLLSHAQKRYIVVIHGGAGTLQKKDMPPELEQQYKEKLKEALYKAYEKLQQGQTAIEAVEAAIVVMEDSPLFNAGKGAVFTSEGKNELDASVMYGKDKTAGAVAGVTTIKNPIKAAVAVMQKSEHVMLIGKGAEYFAKTQGLKIVNPKYFWTQHRWDALQKVKKAELKANQPNAVNQRYPAYYLVDKKFGTVGCVALDKDGNLAAGTSTGGMTNKKYGRVGDSPIIGAGTYADKNIGISGTGWGEFYIRTSAARTVAAKYEYQNKDVKTATQEVMSEIENMGGDGGIIALDKSGNMAMTFNTEGMYRGAITSNGEIEVEIYK